jgi:hypothetical protein
MAMNVRMQKNDRHSGGGEARIGSPGIGLGELEALKAGSDIAFQQKNEFSQFLPGRDES